MFGVATTTQIEKRFNKLETQLEKKEEKLDKKIRVLFEKNIGFMIFLGITLWLLTTLTTTGCILMSLSGAATGTPFYDTLLNNALMVLVMQVFLLCSWAYFGSKMTLEVVKHKEKQIMIENKKLVKA